MTRDRSDLRWAQLSGREKAWQRLRWARETHGAFPNAEAFARRIKENAHNYRAHERDPDGPSKHVALDFDKAVKWASELDVRWQWLLEGEGAPWLDDAARTYSAEARELADAVERLPEAERRAKVEAIKALLTGTGG